MSGQLMAVVVEGKIRCITPHKPAESIMITAMVIVAVLVPCGKLTALGKVSIIVIRRGARIEYAVKHRLAAPPGTTKVRPAEIIALPEETEEDCHRRGNPVSRYLIQLHLR